MIDGLQKTVDLVTKRYDGPAGKIMNAVAADQRCAGLVDDSATVDVSGCFVYRHPRHLRLQHVAWPKVGCNAFVPGGQAAVDIPLFTGGLCQKCIGQFVNAVR